MSWLWFKNSNHRIVECRSVSLCIHMFSMYGLKQIARPSNVKIRIKMKIEKKPRSSHRTDDDDRERLFPFQIDAIPHKSKSIRTVRKIYHTRIKCERNESLNGKMRAEVWAWSDINVIKFRNFTSFASFLSSQIHCSGKKSIFGPFMWVCAYFQHFVHR